jgi:glycosyltransferase involved in cell wall biosynthesis
MNISGGIVAYVRSCIPSKTTNDIETFIIGSELPLFSNFIMLCKKKKSNFFFAIKLFFFQWSLPNSPSIIFHVHQPYMILPLLFKTKSHIVLGLHGYQDVSVKRRKTKLIYFLYQYLTNFSLKLCNNVIADNEENLVYYEKNYSISFKNKQVIPVGVDLLRFNLLNKSKLRQKYGFSKEENIILFIGRLVNDKNLELLLESFKILKNKNIKKLRLIIVGKGILLNGLIKKVQTEEIYDVDFVSNATDNQIPEFMNLADVFAITSFREGGPIVLKEALACNLKVVSVSVGDVSKVLPNFSGSIISSYDPDQFAHDLEKTIYYSDKIDYSQEIKKYSTKENLNKLFDFYHQITS